MFFVLTTGRSGSQTIARTFSQAANCFCRHEPEPQLLAECTRYRYGRMRHSSLAEVLRSTRPTDDGVVYGEANNRLALILPVLRSAFPDARFVWLVRDGRKFVSSALQRGWFDPSRPGWQANPVERTRLRGDLVGDVDADEWRRWRPFHKVCWTWQYVNRLVRSEVDHLGAEAHGPVRLEELDSHLDTLVDFRGLIPPPRWNLDRWNSRVARQLDGETVSDPLNRVWRLVHWTDWSVEQRRIFE